MLPLQPNSIACGCSLTCPQPGITQEQETTHHENTIRNYIPQVLSTSYGTRQISMLEIGAKPTVSLYAGA